MNSEFFDAIVIGGGITGAGVLRDLALRGAKTVLVEKGELGQATTASSSQLIHGGLRYLLYDRLTTHATCWDSGHIVRIARPLLTRLPILWPVYRDHRRGLETVETLLESYDGFQRMKEGKKHLRLSALETRRLVPGLKEDGLVGGLLFDEYWVDAVQLVRANVASAVARGRHGADKTDVTGFAFGPQKMGVRLRLSEGQEEIRVGLCGDQRGGAMGGDRRGFGPSGGLSPAPERGHTLFTKNRWSPLGPPRAGWGSC
jgi:glycerol-3-phosphate dehydrogenase